MAYIIHRCQMTAALVLVIFGSGAAVAQYEIAPGLAPEGKTPSNPFRAANYQAAEPADSAPSSASDQPQAAADSIFKPIGAVGVDIASALTGDRPQSALIAPEQGMSTTTVLMRPWPTMSYHWVAAATRHNPLYFEEVNAERYGYTCSPCLQPFISTAHFFGTLPALPYLKGADCCWECQYTLGHYRPGSCNPWRTHYWPVSARGALCQAGVVTGISFLP